MPSFSGLGYSSYLWVLYFREYCVQRIVKMVADFSATYHFRSPEAQREMEKSGTNDSDVSQKG